MNKYVIRLRRIGRWHQPIYEIIVVFAGAKVNGGLVFEKLGFYSPRGEVKFFFLNFCRFSHWLVTGAAVSPAVGKLIGKISPLKVR